MSRVFRTTVEAPPVRIGQVEGNVAAERAAESRIRSLFPSMRIAENPNGDLLLPLVLFPQIEAHFQTELAKAREQATRDGHQRGYQEGLQEGLGQARTVAASFDQAISDLVIQREQLLQEARQDIIAMILKVSRKVTFEAVQTDESVVTAIVDSLLAQVGDRSQIRIRVHPDQVTLVRQHLEQFTSEDAMARQFAIEPDPRAHKGGCFIETPSGDLDARLDSQFEIIAQTLNGVMEAG